MNKKKYIFSMGDVKQKFFSFKSIARNVYIRVYIRNNRLDFIKIINIHIGMSLFE